MICRLNSEESIPANLLAEVIKLHSNFLLYESLEELVNVPQANDLAERLNALCLEANVAVYHFTRADRAEILGQGLRSRSGLEWRDTFLRKHSHLFSNDDIAHIKKVWADYFDGYQRSIRDYRIWFNLSFSALQSSKADRLLTNYGGENVYMPFKREENIASVLQSLGDPLVIECMVTPSDLLLHGDIDFGKVWLSSLHQQVNPRARLFDQDVCMTQDISPERILRIAEVKRNGRISCHWDIENWTEVNKMP